jgi:hypothetical protein
MSPFKICCMLIAVALLGVGLYEAEPPKKKAQWRKKLIKLLTRIAKAIDNFNDRIEAKYGLHITHEDEGRVIPMDRGDDHE